MGKISKPKTFGFIYIGLAIASVVAAFIFLPDYINRDKPAYSDNPNGPTVREAKHNIALVEAIQKGDTLSVKRLLKKDIDINHYVEIQPKGLSKRWAHWSSPLAAAAGQIRGNGMLKVLLAADADPNLQAPRTLTPNLVACAIGDAVYETATGSDTATTKLQMLVDAGVDLNQSCGTYQELPMYRTKGGGPFLQGGFRHDAFDFLIKNGYDIDGRGHDGITAFLGAVRDNYYLLAMKLIEAGANPFIPDNNGRNVRDYLHGRNSGGVWNASSIPRDRRHYFELIDQYMEANPSK